MLVAAQVSAANGVGLNTPLPSLHRPELIKYAGGNPDYTTMLRPNKNDHPTFYQNTNPSFNPTWDGVTAGQGQWDVDNDGDGIADSVWVDLGFPVRAAADGRLYKPLFAILCVDLDGRLNLNAHGNNGQATQSSSNLSAPSLTAAITSKRTNWGTHTGGTLAGTSPNNIFGAGHRLRPGRNQPAAAVPEFREFLHIL